MSRPRTTKKAGASGNSSKYEFQICSEVGITMYDVLNSFQLFINGF